MLSMAAVMLLCSCRGNDPIQMLESNSVTFEQQETGREEETTACDTVETTTEVAEEETTVQDSSSEEGTSDETTSQETTTVEITTQETTKETTTKKPADKTTAPTTTKKTADKTTAPTTTKKPADKTTTPTTTKRPATETTTKQEETTTQAQKVIYTVTVGIKDVGALGGVEVYIYGDSSHKNMVKSGTTDYYGSVQFELPKSDKYSIVLDNVPKEYKVSSAYSFNGNNAVITLTTGVIKEPLPASLEVGDIMYDITVTAPSGKTYTLSEILEKKNMVVLNFWYANCGWCIKEFPYINEAYLKYKDDIEVLAVNPYDSMSSIDYVQSNYGLKFPMVSCDNQLVSTFGIPGFPTTVVIDKYGVILMIEVGARVEAEYWEELFGAFAE